MKPGGASRSGMGVVFGARRGNIGKPPPGALLLTIWLSVPILSNMVK